MILLTRKVNLTRVARKNLETVPKHITSKLKAWVNEVEVRGLEEVRKVPGYHDEPLQGRRKGERSIRLSKTYRAIYDVRPMSQGRCIFVKEVHKHDY